MIVKTPGCLGGKARIDGHRIGVWWLVLLRDRHGWSPARILDEYDQLSAEKISAAFDYYEKNREEIDQEIADHDRAWEEADAAT